MLQSMATRCAACSLETKSLRVDTCVTSTQEQVRRYFSYATNVFLNRSDRHDVLIEHIIMCRARPRKTDIIILLSFSHLGIGLCVSVGSYGAFLGLFSPPNSDLKYSTTKGVLLPL